MYYIFQRNFYFIKKIKASTVLSDGSFGCSGGIGMAVAEERTPQGLYYSSNTTATRIVNQIDFMIRNNVEIAYIDL